MPQIPEPTYGKALPSLALELAKAVDHQLAVNLKEAVSHGGGKP